MGSPSAELNVLESARPWYQNGLQFLFKEALPDLSPAAPSSASRPAVQKSPAPMPEKPVQTPAQPVSAGSGSSDRQGFRQPTPPARPSRVPVRKPSPASAKVNFPEPCSWPEPWSKLAERITPRLQIFWTYAQLAQDLSGQADAQRRKLFQSLIGYMGLPKGAISFWPCTTWNGSSLEGSPDVFWNGVRSYGVKFVACFGDEARELLAPSAPPGASTVHVDNIQLVMLNDPDFLKTLPPEEQQLLCISLLRLPLF
ncbi:hypothetical protein [Maridesulfovibrio sp.]|uniref:hypothetical protein n=1 Tax=Maridesulfovibrio sp. TaxID=2795000 RepID=UPI002A186E92|nr:hypothetical protein [Maridesulfovibrio sp.]